MTDFSRVISLYPELLDFTYQVIQSLKGVKSDSRMIGCEHLARKIFYHAATIYEVSKGTNLTLSNYESGAHIMDFPSVIVLTRTVFETYLNMYEVYFEPNSEDDFEFRYAVFQLEGLAIREKYIPQNPDATLQKRVEKGIIEIDDIRKRIKNTNAFKSLTLRQQKQALKGKMQPEREREHLAACAGFGPQSVSKAYAYHSAYVHGDALSGIQIADARAGDKGSPYMETSLVLVMAVLAKLIMNYSQKFPEAQAMCRTHPAQFQKVQLISTGMSRAK